MHTRSPCWIQYIHSNTALEMHAVCIHSLFPVFYTVISYLSYCKIHWGGAILLSCAFSSRIKLAGQHNSTTSIFRGMSTSTVVYCRTICDRKLLLNTYVRTYVHVPGTHLDIWIVRPFAVLDERSQFSASIPYCSKHLFRGRVEHSVDGLTLLL